MSFRVAFLALLPAICYAFTGPSASLPLKHGVKQATSFMPSSPMLAPSVLPTLRQQTHTSTVPLQMATTGIGFPELKGNGMRIGIVYTRWNSEIVNKLREGAKRALTEKCGVDAANIVEFEVPGSWELPVAARYMVLAQKVDAVIPIGVLIKGETDHYDMIKDATCSALMTLQLETGIPVMNGILGCHNMAQAEARATGDNNHGVWWGQSAVEMATLRATQMGKMPAPGQQEKKKVLF